MLVNQFKNYGIDVSFFADEKKFVVGEVSNQRNSMIFELNLLEKPHNIEIKSFVSVMKFSGVASHRNKTPQYFIKESLKISTAKYIKVLQTLMLSYIKKEL